MPRPCPSRLCPAAAATLLFGTIAFGQSFVNWETPQVHPLDRTPNGSFLLVVNTADNRLEIFDVSTGAPLLVRSVPVGLDPVSVRARNNTEAWVVNLVSDSICVIDIPTGRVVRTVTVGDEPADVVFAGQPLRAFVSLSQVNRVVRLDPNNLAAPPTVIPIQGEDPRSLAVSSDGLQVYAAIYESGNHSTSVPRGAVSNPTGPYGGQNPPPNLGTVFSPPILPGLPPRPVVSHIVRKAEDGTWRDGNGANWSNFIAWDLHDHDVAIIDTASLAVSYASGLMTTVSAVSVSPNGTVTAVGTEAKNEIRFEQNLNGIFIRAVVASFAEGDPASASMADLNPHLDYSTSSVAGLVRQQSIGDPRGIAWAPTGSMMYVSGMGSNTVIASDSTTGARLGQVTVGQGPTGLAMSVDGTRLFVLNRFEGTISMVDTTTMTELSRTAFFDPTPEPIRLGRPFLYDTHLTSGLGQASCASCHLDARTDHLAWDLGNTQGAMIAFDEICNGPNCIPWHPMKGPMVTQTLQGIIGNEPFHWRGEKNDLTEFNAAYTDLQGADAQLSAEEMQHLVDFVASITYPPNPNRNIDNSLRNTLPVFAGNGNPQNGLTIYQNAPLLGGQTCAFCHPLSDGTNTLIASPIGPEPQNRKMAQLRNMHEKSGADTASLQANRGFGFNHDGEFFTLNQLLSIGFTFPPGPPGQQQRRDVEAFMLSLSVDTHAGVGAQTTASNGGGPGDNIALINQMLGLAGGSQVGLTVKGILGGAPRGWAFQSGTFQSDRAAESIAPAALLALAAPGSELTYTLVPIGSQNRIGIDRDQDGYLDRDELDAGSNPADPKSIPGSVCIADFTGDGMINGADLGVLLSLWGLDGIADINRDGVVNGTDLGLLLSAWGPCP